MRDRIKRENLIEASSKELLFKDIYNMYFIRL